MPTLHELKTYLDALVERFETPAFVHEDPVAIPHGYDDPRDQETIGLYAALLAWGRRKTILAKLEELSRRMRYRPAAFVSSFCLERDAHALSGFRHRTFQSQDAIYLTRNLSLILRRFGSVEAAFAHHLTTGSMSIQPALQQFSDLLFHIHPDTPARLRKHLARPDAGSACKRFNMYLRWMVRPGPVDLGIWTTVRPSQLVLPLDIHAGRQARALGMLRRRQNDWKAALELTEQCRLLCPEDPCRYDYAFFGTGAYGIDLDPRFIGNDTLYGRSD